MTALPPGWTTASFNEYYSKIRADAVNEGNKFAISLTPHPFNRMMAVTLGDVPGPMPAFATGSDATEWSDTYTTVMKRRGDFINNYIASRVPAYLQPNLADAAAQNPPPSNPLGPINFTTPGTLPPGSAISRGGTAWYFDSTGTLVQATGNNPRFAYDPVTGAYLGLLNEPHKTNYIRNNTMVGAVAGTPGTNPTNWSNSPTNGLSLQIVGTGTEDGINYIDFRYFGTTNAQSAFNIVPEVIGNIFGQAGQTWTASCYCRLVAGALTAYTAPFFVQIREFNAALSTVRSSNSPSNKPTNAPLKTQRYTVTRTFIDATTTYFSMNMQIGFLNAETLDFTLRIGLPQAELSDVATSPIPTAGTIVTRPADRLVYSAMQPGSVYNLDVTRVSGTTSYQRLVASSPGVVYIPESASPIISMAPSSAIPNLVGVDVMRTVPAGATLVRTSAGWANGIDRALASVSSGNARFQYDPLQSGLQGIENEIASTNLIHNSTCVGAVVGTPGTLPTTWLTSSLGTVAANVVATGTWLGMPYVDVRYVGTTNGTGAYLMLYDASQAIGAGVNVVASAWLAIVAGSFANVNSLVLAPNFAPSGVPQSPFLNTLLTGSLQRVQVAAVTPAGTTAFTLRLNISWTNGAAIDFTLRHCQPQFEQIALNMPTSPIPTTNAGTVTRNAETLTVPFTQGGFYPAITVKRANGSTVYPNVTVGTNSIRNPTGTGTVGAAPGSGGGTPPTNWVVPATANGVTRTIIGSGIENGIAYVDIQYSATSPTNTSGVGILSDGFTQFAAASGQTWTGSCYCKLAAGSINGVTLTQGIVGRLSNGNTSEANTLPFVPTTASLDTQPLTQTRMMTSANTAFVSQQINLNYKLGVPFDITIRFGFPSLYGPSTWVVPNDLSPVQTIIGDLTPTDTSIAANWQSRVIAQGGTVSAAQLDRVARFMTTLRTAGLDTSFDAIWLMAAENVQQATTSLFSGKQLTPVANPTFTAGRGFKCDGVNSYLLGEVQTNVVKFTQNDCMEGGWLVTYPTNAISSGIDFGHDDSMYSGIWCHYGTTQSRFDIQARTFGNNVIPSGINQTGCMFGQRTGPNTETLWVNGSVFLNGTAPSNPITSANGSTGGQTATGAFACGTYAMIRQSDGVAFPTAARMSDGEYGALFYGASCRGKEVDLTNALRQYMTSVGLP